MSDAGPERGVHEAEICGRRLRLRATLGAGMAFEGRREDRNFMRLCQLLPMQAFMVSVTDASVMIEEFARAAGDELPEGFLDHAPLGDMAEIYDALVETCVASGLLERREEGEGEDGVAADPTKAAPPGENGGD